KMKTHVELTVLSAAELGVKADESSLSDVYERARQAGLELCPAEVGPQLRLDYRNQPLGEALDNRDAAGGHVHWRPHDHGCVGRREGRAGMETGKIGGRFSRKAGAILRTTNAFVALAQSGFPSAATGCAAPPPSSVMNSRRFIRFLIGAADAERLAGLHKRRVISSVRAP